VEEQKQTDLDINSQKPKFWIWEKKLPKTLCELLIEESKNFELKNDAVIGSDNKINKKIRNTDVTWAPLNHWIEGILLSHAFYANYQAKWNYNVSHSEPVQIGTYTIDSHYDWHEDWHPFNGLTTIRKLTTICMLSNESEYQGGEFQLHNRDPVKLKQGTIFVFPSFVRHKVHPVTLGTRISAVSWIHGNQTF
jgi:PKHD-type hydroxylase